MAYQSADIPQIDVSHLPDSAMDYRDPVWWGNTLAILIETTTMALLIVTYFYLWRNFTQWPPPQPNRNPPIFDTLPNLKAGTANVVLIALSCLVMYATDMAARRRDRWLTALGLAVMFVVACVAIDLRFHEFSATHFRWNDNAYASIVWTILGMHLTYLIAAGLEFLIMALWLVFNEFDKPHALDVTLGGGYWYWVAGTAIATYAVIYWAPRLM